MSDQIDVEEREFEEESRAHGGKVRVTVETCCFWYGTRTDSVTAVVVPRQRQTWGNYHVAVNAMQLLIIA